MNDGLTIGIFILIALACLGGWLYYEHRRTEAWKAVAERLGFIFVGDGRNLVLHGSCGAFKLFQKGSSRKVKNTIRGDNGGIEVILSDYQYTVRSSGSRNNSSTTYRQTICILRDEEIRVPHFFLRRQSMIYDFLGSLFGGQDIDFDDDPEFSKRFVLQGEDEGAIRVAFTPAVRARLCDIADSRMQLEAWDRTLMFHRGRRESPDRADDLIGEAFGLMRMFKA